MPGLAHSRFARSIALTFALACLGNSDTAQPSLDQAFTVAYDALGKGRYLEAADALRPLAIDGDGRVRDVRALQLWNQFRADIAGEPYRPPGESPGKDEPSLVQRLSGARAEPAIETIADYARHTRIVILNEDHVHPRQRAFALQVARALRPLGYDVLALEALNNRGDSRSRMSALERRGYVVLGDGFYTRDPVFADFVRQALRLGYAPASYEDVARHEGSSDERIRAREEGQAENLLRIIKSRSRAKLLIYVGQSHLAEKPLPFGNGKLSWMAAQLARLSGIDPLTVDQATLDQDCGICGRLSGPDASPVIFVRGSNPIVVGQYEGAVDLQVFEPEQPSVAGRPGWLVHMGRAPVAVPRALLPARGRRLVQAFVSSESSDAIPVDQFVVTAGRPAPDFMLPRSKIRYSFQQAELHGDRKTAAAVTAN